MARAVWVAAAAAGAVAVRVERVWSREAGLMDRVVERPMPAAAVALVAPQTRSFTALI